MNETGPSEKVDPQTELERCAQEPVHIIGKIQPHGLLFALTEPDLIVRQMSSNVSALLGMLPERVLGKSIEAVLGSAQFALLQAEVLSPVFGANPMRMQIGRDATEMLCVPHRQDGVLIVELEILEGVYSFEPLDLNAHIALPLSRMELASSLLELSHLAASEIQRLSGFDRVMVYRFDQDWNGEVIAEVVAPDQDSYLRLHFPATDIPAQARRLFLLNRLRAIVDVDAIPVPILPEIGPVTGRPLDLTSSFLRSASPIHLQYLRNMGVQSSLTVSIVVAQQLWGMIVCHHPQRRHVDYSTRAICELIGQMLGAQVALRIDNGALQQRLAARTLLQDYMAEMDSPQTLSYADQFNGKRLVELFGADGLISHVDCVFCSQGHTVEPELLLPVIRRLREVASRGIASTDMLGALDPGAASYASLASGALYIGLTEERGDYLLLLRREQIEAVKWAGNPDKSVNTDADGKLHPRTSFEAWQEVVRGRSVPWSDLEVENAIFLREQLLRLRASIAMRELEKLRLQEAAHGERSFRFLADTMAQLIWTAKADGTVDYYNERWIAYMGVPAAEMLGWDWTPAVHPDDLPNLFDLWTRTIKNEVDYLVEARLRRGSDGAFRWHLMRASAQRTENGKVLRWVGTCTDIEDQKQARNNLERGVAERTAELATAQAKLQMVLDGSTNVAIIATDLDGLITVFNAGAEQMLGYRSEELVGKHSPGVFHLESEVVARGLELSEQLGERVEDFDVFVHAPRSGKSEEREWTYVRKDGSQLGIKLVATGLRDTSGMLVGYLGVASDVTARKKAENAARASAEHYRLIVESIEEYEMITLDVHGNVTHWNAGAEQLKGYKADEIIGRHFSCFYLPEDVERGHPDEELRIASAEGHYSEEGWRVRKDGSRFWANVFIGPIHDEAGRIVGFAKVLHDLTARNQSERSLREQAIILDTANDTIFIRDEKGCISYWNQGAQKMYGWDKGEAVGRISYDLLNTEFPEPLDTIITQLHAEGRWAGELVRTRRDGSVVSVATSWTLQRNDATESISILEVSHDITANRQAENLLRESATRLALATQVLQAGVWEWDVHTDDILWDETMHAMYGFAKDLPITYKVWADAVVPEELGQTEAILQRVIESKTSITSEFSIALPDGSVRHIQSAQGVVLDDAGEVVRMVGVNLDATERKLNEYRVLLHSAHLQAANERMQVVVRRLGLATDALKAGVWDHDLRTNILLCDARMHEIYGLAEDADMDYQMWRDALLPEDIPAVDAGIEQVIASRSQSSSQFRIKQPNGSIRYIQAASGAILDDAGEVVGIIGINIDTTDRKFNEDLERQVSERTMQLKAVNKELEDFAYVASHDLKAPLRVIDNASKWLEEDLQEFLTDDTRETLSLMQSRVRRMERLLDDLLEYARIGRAVDARYAETVYGDELMDGVLALLAPTDLTLTVSPAFAGVEVCRMPLQQILTNLIGNAIKHHDKKTGRIEVTVKEEGDCYVFAVEDDGPGIDPQFHDQVFKMFQTLKPRDQVEGSGMGLAMVRKSVEVFGGVLELDSAEGKGCIFSFTWPKQQRLVREAA